MHLIKDPQALEVAAALKARDLPLFMPVLLILKKNAGNWCDEC